MKKWVAGLALLPSSSSVFGQQYDVLIRNGRVVDGMGNPWVYADEGLPVGTHSMLDHRCRSSFSHSHRAVRSLVGRALRRRKAKSPSFSLLQEEIKQMRASSWWSHGQDCSGTDTGSGVPSPLTSRRSNRCSGSVWESNVNPDGISSTYEEQGGATKPHKEQLGTVNGPWLFPRFSRVARNSGWRKIRPHTCHAHVG